MHTPSFWYPQSDDAMAAWAPAALSPFSYLFQAATLVRRCFAKPYRARVPVVCVGNVVAGGAGKTPTALALAQILKDQGHRPVFVTGGYGGTDAVTHVDLARHFAADVGDEALLLAASAPTWVGRDRSEAIRLAQSHGSIVIMDDGLQNPHIAPTTSLLVIDGEVGIGNGRIIPAGPLRETLASVLKRVSAVIILGDHDRQNLAAQIKVPVFRARVQPTLPAGFPHMGKFVAFAGIARPEKFYTTAHTLGLDILDEIDFDDHYLYDEADINALRLRAEEQGARLLTTEKDAVRLPPDFRNEVVILPVGVVFDTPYNAADLAKLCMTRR